MIMYKLRILLFVILVGGFSSCVQNKNPQQAQSVIQPNQKVFEVTDVIQGNSYTYLKVKENMMDRWVAVSKQDVNKGDVYYYDSALQMNDFHSKEIDRTFDEIYFVNQISKTPLASAPAAMGGSSTEGGAMSAHSGKVAASDAEVEIAKPEGELTIADVYSNRNDYAGKEFEIRGAVVKVNNQVMGKNWVHIQDGTADGGNFDLTITTQADVKVGDEVTFKGKLTLNKDFGAGYSYDVIMEDGELITKKVS